MMAIKLKKLKNTNARLAWAFIQEHADEFAYGMLMNAADAEARFAALRFEFYRS